MDRNIVVYILDVAVEKNNCGDKKEPRRERENFFTPICYFTGFHVAVAVVVVTAEI